MSESYFSRMYISLRIPWEQCFQKIHMFYCCNNPNCPSSSFHASLAAFSLQRCPKRLSHSLALPFLWREIAAVHKPAVRILGGHGQQALGDRFFQGLSRASLAAS